MFLNLQTLPITDFQLIDEILASYSCVLTIKIRSTFQYLGFGAPVTGGQGRRAVAQEATLHSSSQSAEEENAEKDQALKQVQARDLIDFGMIPVS